MPTIFRKFTTRDSNVPATLGGSPVISVYKDAVTTPSTAGVTLTVDFNGKTGFNHVAVDTSADAAFYANGSHFDLVITTGTVGGTSVVGEVVGSFDLTAATADPLAFPVPGSYAAGTAGYVLGNRLDAAVSTRSTYTGGDTSGTTTLLGRLTAPRATGLDYLDAAVSSRMAAGGSVMTTLDLTQAVPTSNTAGTVGDALNAARAQGFGRWTIAGTTLTLYGPDGTTIVRTFTLDSATAPTSRT